MIERFNENLFQMIKSFINGKQNPWDINLGCISNAITKQNIRIWYLNETRTIRKCFKLQTLWSGPYIITKKRVA